MSLSDSRCSDATVTGSIIPPSPHSQIITPLSNLRTQIPNTVSLWLGRPVQLRVSVVPRSFHPGGHRPYSSPTPIRLHPSTQSASTWTCTQITSTLSLWPGAFVQVRVPAGPRSPTLVIIGCIQAPPPPHPPTPISQRQFSGILTMCVMKL